MRILVGSWPGYGHLLPMLPLVRAAQAAGHDVLVSTGVDLHPLLDQLQVPAHRSGFTLLESYQQMPGDTRISALPPEEQPIFAAQHLFGNGAVRRARDVLALLDGWRPDLVVHDTLELGSAAAAVMTGIPHVTHGYGPTVPRSDEFAAAIGRTIAAAGLADPIPDVLAAPYLDNVPPSARGPEPNPWSTILPIRPSPGEHDGTELGIDLDGLPHDRTVYVTLGTVMNQNPEVFRAVLEGCARLPVNLLVTTGPGLDPTLLGPLSPAVRTAPFLPQAAVLPLCTAVVSHTGAGTMLGALCHGLPQLCIPQGTDQPSNTDALLPTGAALALQPADVTADSVADALGRLLDEPTYRAAAEALRAEIEAMPTSGEVLPRILPATA